VRAPERAATWDWPTEAEFQARFSLWPSEAWSFGVVIGRRLQRGADGVAFGGLEVRLTEPADDAATLLVDPEPLRFCRGGRRFQRWTEPILSGHPFEPGELELRSSGDYGRGFLVESVAPPRRLLAEDWRDLVYARTILDAGLDLALANRETAESETREACEDDACLRRTERAALAREAELANACNEAGLAACYLAGRLQIIGEWARSRGLGYFSASLGADDAPLGVDAAPPPAGAGVRARGPVDLGRFFFGLLLDADLMAPATVRCWEAGAQGKLARAIAETGNSASIADELQQRALDSRRDPWTRARVVQLLTALCDLEPALGCTVPEEPDQAGNYASMPCALAVLASSDWTLSEAHAGCVQAAREVDERTWRNALKAHFLLAMKVLEASRSNSSRRPDAASSSRP
jgi:hypothetical protein